MLFIRRLYIDLQLKRNVQFEAPELVLWGLPSESPTAEEERYRWEIAEIQWLIIILDALRTSYGVLGFPPSKIIDGYTSRDPAAMSRWYRQLEGIFKQKQHTEFWRLRRRGLPYSNVYFASLHHPGRKVDDWLLWDYGYYIDLRFHPSIENDAEDLIETLFMPMQRFLIQRGFPILTGLPIEVTYEREGQGLRSIRMSEFFDDLGLPHPHQNEQ